MRKQQLSDAVSVRFFMPSEPLVQCVSTYYLTEVSVPEGEQVCDWLHPEWANVRFASTLGMQSAVGSAPLQQCPRVIAAGPTSRASQFVTGPVRIWGIGLLPAGWARLVQGAACDYADRAVDGASDPAFAGFAPLLDRLFLESPEPAREAAMIDAHLTALLTERPPADDHERILAAHGVLLDEDVSSVADFANLLGISARSLERLSLRVFGFAPKLLLRRQRFLRSLAQFMLDPSLSWIRTLDSHYVDQAHFVRDFKRFMGMSPRQYAALDHPVLRAAAQARTAAAGAAVQVLHRP